MNFFSTWWHKHKVKTLGGLAMLVGAAQANFGQIQTFIPPHKQGLILFAFGMLTAFFGFLNSSGQ